MSPMVYIGVDLAPARPPFTMVVLDAERRLAALSQGPLAAVLAYCAGQSEAIVAIAAPQLPAGLPAAVQTALPEMDLPAQASTPAAHPAEVALRAAGFPCAQLRGHPAWLQSGVQLVTRLGELDYRPYPGEAARRWLETRPDAAFQSLLDAPPFAAATLEGRLQRQLALRAEGLPVPDAMNFFEEVTRHKLLRGILPLKEIYLPGELNAFLAAHTAWLAAAHPERLRVFGDPAQCALYLPAPAPADPNSRR